MPNKVRLIRRERQLSTHAAAQKIGVHIRTLYRYLARGIVREPAHLLPAEQGSIYPGRLRHWSTDAIEAARLAIQDYHGRADEKKKVRRSRRAPYSAKLGNLLTTNEVLDTLKITQPTLNLICSARAARRWGRAARLRPAARNDFSSRLFDPHDVREWYEYMTKREEQCGDLTILQRLDGTPLFASSHERFEAALLAREMLNSRKRSNKKGKAKH